MLFNSGIFALFLAAFLPLYFLSWRRVAARNLLLIASCYVFYGWWDPRFLILVAISTSVDYLAALGAAGKEVRAIDQLRSVAFLVLVTFASLACATSHDWWLASPVAIGMAIAALAIIAIKRSAERVRRKYWLLLSLCTNLGILAFFKYFNFFVGSATAFLEALGVHAQAPSLAIILPVGLSFYTFQAISRTIDSYQRRYEPQYSIINYAAFHAFFPQLVAGPIERAGHLMPQFETVRPFDRQMFTSGALLFALGPLSKNRDSRQRIADCQCGIQRAGPPNRGRHLGGGIGIRRADLLRLLRLLQHGTRACTLSGVRSDDQLQPAVFRSQPVGVLAALAHQPIAMAARLFVHTARRQSRRAAQDVPQSHDHDAAGGIVARRILDLRCLGSISRRNPSRLPCAADRLPPRALAIFHVARLRRSNRFVVHHDVPRVHWLDSVSLAHFRSSRHRPREPVRAHRLFGRPVFHSLRLLRTPRCRRDLSARVGSNGGVDGGALPRALHGSGRSRTDARCFQRAGRPGVHLF